MNRSAWKNCACFIASVLWCGMFTVPARGQAPPAASVPRYEVSGSYSYIRAASNGDFNLNGGSATFAHLFADRISVLADVGAYRFSGLPAGLSSTMHSYLFGPRLLLRNWGRITPFGQVLLGVVRLNATSGSIAAGENGFGMSAGGGADWTIRRKWAFRIVQADYLLTRFPHTDGSSASQNDLRISTGIVYRFDVH